MSDLRLSSVAGWRQYTIAALALLVWTVFVYRDTAVSLVITWTRSATFTHGFLVLPITCWLVWRQRFRLLERVPAGAPRLLPFALALGLVWFLGDLVGSHSIAQLAFVGMLITSVVIVIGQQAAKTIAFPLGFLLFAVPAGEFLLPVLMEWTADFTVLALKVSGIPVHREGLQFVIPSGHWSVVEACSGVRYLIASLAIGTLFANLNYVSWERRLVFVGISILVPIVANWLRAYLIVMLGHFSDNSLAAGVDHLVYGWVFFGIVIMVTFAIGSRWSESGSYERSVGVPAVGVKRGERVGTPWVVAAAAALVILVPKFLSGNPPDTVVRPELSNPSIPLTLTADWKLLKSPALDWKPSFKSRPVVETEAAYVGANGFVGLHVAFYHAQTYEHKLVSSDNALVRAEDMRWQKTRTGSASATCGSRLINVRTVHIVDTLAQVASGPILAWQFYWINGTIVTNNYLAVLYSAYYRIVGAGDAAASVVIYSSSTEPTKTLAAFLRDNCELIDERLRAVAEAQQRGV